MSPAVVAPGALLVHRRGPSWVAAWSLDRELAAWLGRVLIRDWPGLRFDRSSDPGALAHWQVDLWLVDRLPPQPPPRPLLYLCGPERRARLTRAGPWVWELPAPILRDTLVEAVRVVFMDLQENRA